MNNLTAYLQNYQNSLEQALKDQNLSLSGQEDIKVLLDYFAVEAENLSKEVKQKQELMNQFIPKR